MLILVLVLTFGAFIVFAKLTNKYSSKRDIYRGTIWDFFMAMSVVFGVVSAGLIIAICCIAPKVATESIYDDKIAMCQEENVKIEQEVDKIVETYLKHEKNTYKDLKTEKSAITLVTLFPEIKSDSLVQRQLGIYVDNNTTIKNLKARKIELRKLKWILYFGK